MNHTKYKSLPDDELINLILREGETALFEILYNRYYGKVRDKAYGLLRNRRQAEEFATDILARAFEKLGGFRGKSTFSTWLYTITYNYCIDYLREKKKLHYPEWNRQNELPEIIDETWDDPVDIDQERLAQILEMIHPEEKALLLMKYQENASVKEIGEALRISESAVKMRLKRARARVVFFYYKLDEEEK